MDVSLYKLFTNSYMAPLISSLPFSILFVWSRDLILNGCTTPIQPPKSICCIAGRHKSVLSDNEGYKGEYSDIHDMDIEGDVIVIPRLQERKLLYYRIICDRTEEQH